MSSSNDANHTAVDSYENVADETPREAKAPRMKPAPDYSGPARRGDKGLIVGCTRIALAFSPRLMRLLALF